jgi:hypothetical protein
MDYELVVRSVIIGTVVSSVLYAIMMWMAGAPASVNSTGDVYTLRYGWVVRAAGYYSIAGAAFFAIVWQWPPFDRLPEPGDGWIVLGLVVGPAGVGAWALNEARRRVLLSGQGIEVLSPWGRTVRLPWPEVSSVAFSRMAQQFTIRGRSGQRVHVSAAMVGMPTFVDHLRQYVPPAVHAEALKQYDQYAGHV